LLCAVPLQPQRIAPLAAISNRAMTAMDSTDSHATAAAPARQRTVVKNALWGAVIGAAAGGIVALVEGVQGTDCLNATVSGCGAPNHSARDIGLGAALGAVIGAMMGYALHH